LVANTAAVRGVKPDAGALARLADRWIYVFMAGLFLVTAVVGFAPRSAAILAGERPNPPLVVHIHAALMVSWLVLLLAQTTLAATGRGRLHRTLGLASVALAPAVVAAMIAITIWRFGERVELGQMMAGANILLAQGRSIFCFSLFYAWAILVRGRDSETHKRMMILATLTLLTAAITRITWLPTTMPASYDAVHGYMLLLLVPALAYDIARRGRPHAAYLIGLGLLLPWMIATRLLWDSPWWLATAPRLMGVQGW
jgi:hypothetical protein